MPYVIGRRSTGVYEVIAVDSVGHAIARHEVVAVKGDVVVLDHIDQARQLCRAMNRDRLRRFRERKASQLRLFEGEP